MIIIYYSTTAPIILNENHYLATPIIINENHYLAAPIIINENHYLAAPIILNENHYLAAPIIAASGNEKYADCTSHGRCNLLQPVLGEK